MQRLSGIEISEVGLSQYELYRKIKSILGELGDLHVSLSFPSDFNNYFFFMPVTFYIQTIDGNPKIFARAIDNYFLNDFPKDIVSKIKDNIKYSIKSINCKDPFDYIESFCENFYDTKNIHGTFTYKMAYHNGLFLGSCPLSQSFMKELEVEYENGEKFFTEFIIYNYQDYNKLSYTMFGQKLNIFLIDEFKNFIHETINNISPFSPALTIENLEKKFKEKKSSENIGIASSMTPYSSIIWNYNYANQIKCTSDNINRVNFMYINSFYPDNYDGYAATVDNCIGLFDKNNYPIILYNEVNNGGILGLSHLLLEALSPLISVNYYISISEKVLKFYYIDNFASNHGKIENCENISVDEMRRNVVNIDYGNNVKEKITSPSILGLGSRIPLNYFKSKLKNKRKPNEVIVYTDSYSFSAGAIFLKYFQNSGAGIVVGYSGNPNKKDVPFVSGQSASSLLTPEYLDYLGYSYYDQLKWEFNIKMGLPWSHLFLNEKASNIPLEYDTTVVDENIEFYEKLSESNYQIFVDKAKNIFNKYKTRCNKNNKKLLFITDICDGRFKSKYTHGGFECGDDGKWTQNCVPSYCDEGYYFDIVKKECIEEVCIFYNIVGKRILILIIFPIPLLIALILFIIYKSKLKRKNEINIEN